MTDPQAPAAERGGSPSIIERLGIRSTRRSTGTVLASPVPGADLVDCQVTESGARITVTITQAHELLDQLAWQLNRPDLITAHRYMPQRRNQPGGQK